MINVKAVLLQVVILNFVGMAQAQVSLIPNADLSEVAANKKSPLSIPPNCPSIATADSVAKAIRDEKVCMEMAKIFEDYDLGKCQEKEHWPHLNWDCRNALSFYAGENILPKPLSLKEVNAIELRLHNLFHQMHLDKRDMVCEFKMVGEGKNARPAIKKQKKTKEGVVNEWIVPLVTKGQSAAQYLQEMKNIYLRDPRALGTQEEACVYFKGQSSAQTDCRYSLVQGDAPDEYWVGLETTGQIFMLENAVTNINIIKRMRGLFEEVGYCRANISQRLVKSCRLVPREGEFELNILYSLFELTEIEKMKSRDEKIISQLRTSHGCDPYALSQLDAYGCKTTKKEELFENFQKARDYLCKNIQNICPDGIEILSNMSAGKVDAEANYTEVKVLTKAQVVWPQDLKKWCQ